MTYQPWCLSDGSNAQLGPEAADEHWREQHAPIALEVHKAMTHYYQLTVVHKFFGEPERLRFMLFCHRG